METTQEALKNAQIDEILSICNAFRLQKRAKSQGDFAKILGVDQNTLSSVLHGRGAYSTENLLKRARQVADESGVQISGNNNHIVGGDEMSGHAQKNLGRQTDLQPLISEMAAQREMYDRHISRLLDIVEKMQS